MFHPIANPNLSKIHIDSKQTAEVYRKRTDLLVFILIRYMYVSKLSHKR